MLRFDDYPGAKKYLLKIYRYRKKDPIKEKATRDLADGELVDMNQGYHMERGWCFSATDSHWARRSIRTRDGSPTENATGREMRRYLLALETQRTVQNILSQTGTVSLVPPDWYTILYSSWDTRKTCNSIRVKWLWSIRHWAVSVKNCKNGKRVSIISDVKWVVALVWAHELMSK